MTLASLLRSTQGGKVTEECVAIARQGGSDTNMNSVVNVVIVQPIATVIITSGPGEARPAPCMAHNVRAHDDNYNINAPPHGLASPNVVSRHCPDRLSSAFALTIKQSSTNQLLSFSFSSEKAVGLLV